MKKIKIILAAAAMILCCTTASAQFMGGHSHGAHRYAMGPGYTNFHVSFNPVTLNYKTNGVYDTDNLGAVGFGFASLIPVLPHVPAFAEVGIDGQFTFGSESILGVTNAKVQAFSLKIPVNMVYMLDFGTVSIAPYAGLGLMCNLTGTGTVGSVKYDIYDSDLFNYKKAVLGGQIGARLYTGMLMVGVGYDYGFTNIADHTKASQILLTLGIAL